MSLTRCPSPRCRRPVTDADVRCACGVDLDDVRAAIARLTKPPRTIAWPFVLLQRLSPAARRVLIHDMERAVASAHADDGDPAVLDRSDQLLDETVTTWSSDDDP